MWLAAHLKKENWNPLGLPDCLGEEVGVDRKLVVELQGEEHSVKEPMEGNSEEQEE